MALTIGPRLQSFFDANDCADCPLKTRCTASEKRSLTIHEAEDLLIELRARRRTKRGRSELRKRVTQGLITLGTNLTDDPELRAKVDGWLEQAAGYVVGNYRAEITTLITDTVERWDAEETSRKIELQVGRDLQFIRINGTVVGALAGLVIYAVANVLF